MYVSISLGHNYISLHKHMYVCATQHAASDKTWMKREAVCWEHMATVLRFVRMLLIHIDLHTYIHTCTYVHVRTCTYM